MDSKQAKKIYEDLENLTIHLPKDPSSLGPDYLREQISICRNYLNTVGYHLQRVLQEGHLLGLELEGKETLFQVKSDELLTQDVRVKALPSVDDRQAMVNVLLADDARGIRDTKREILNLKAVEKVLRFRKGELDNTMSAIRLQRSLLKDQLTMGSFYGDESPNSRNKDPVDSMGSEDLASLIDETEAEIAGSAESAIQFNDEEEPEEPEEEEEPVVVAKAAAPKKFKPPKKRSEDQDLIDELESLIKDEDLSEVSPSAGPAKKELPQDVVVPLRENTNPLKGDDIDPEFKDFLSEPDEDIESLLADI